MTRIPDRSTGGAWRNGLYVGSAATRQETIEFTHRDGPPDDRAIEDVVRAVLDPAVDEAVVVAHVEAIESLARTMLDAQSRGTLDHAILLAWADGPLSNPGSAGSAGGTGTSWHGFVLVVLVVLLCSWLGIRMANRLCRSGWRDARDGEWERDPAVRPQGRAEGNADRKKTPQ